MIKDQFTHLVPKYGRQRVWQMRHIAKGLCQLCSNKTQDGHAMCPEHEKQYSEKRAAKHPPVNKSKWRKPLDTTQPPGA